MHLWVSLFLWSRWLLAHREERAEMGFRLWIGQKVPPKVSFTETPLFIEAPRCEGGWMNKGGNAPTFHVQTWLRTDKLKDAPIQVWEEEGQHLHSESYSVCREILCKFIFQIQSGIGPRDTVQVRQRGSLPCYIKLRELSWHGELEP